MTMRSAIPEQASALGEEDQAASASQAGGGEGSRAPEMSHMTVPEFGWKSADPPRCMRYLLPAFERLTRPVAKDLRVLDIGCGNGYLAGWFAKKGCSVVAIDVSRAGIEHARAAHPGVSFHCIGVCPDLLERLGEQPFDLVVSTEVVEHLYAPRDWAAAAFGALRPGGRLICTTPYHGFMKNLMLSVVDGWDRHMNPMRDGGHIKFWSRATLSQLLREAGFVNQKFHGAGRAPLLWMSMIMTAERPQR